MSSEDASSVDRLREFLLQYKVPLFFVLSGLLLIVVAVRVVLGQQQQAAVVFDTQSVASVSAVNGMAVHVDVAGEVIHPGVYTLGSGSRVDDAITAAGGLTKLADAQWIAKQLNRAAKVVDGGKIYIPSRAEESKGQVAGVETHTAAAIPKLVNINLGSQAELEALPGIGPTTAGKIIVGRPYQTIEELKTKKIVGAAVFGKIKEMITL